MVVGKKPACDTTVGHHLAFVFYFKKGVVPEVCPIPPIPACRVTPSCRDPYIIHLNIANL